MVNSARPQEKILSNAGKMFYFIRHAEGEANVSHRRMSNDTMLTALGGQQARMVARRCVRLHAEVLLTSPIFRAVETSAYISQACDLGVVRLELLRERRRPTELDGVLKKSTEALQINRTLRENFHIPNWRFSDEENFEDLKRRAIEVLKYMEACEASRIIAVTHGVIIRIIIACAIHGPDITGEECERFIRGLRMQRAGITALSLNHNVMDEGIASKFQLWIWNDHSHLDE